MSCKFHLAHLKSCAKPLEQSPFRIKHFTAMLQAISLNMAKKKNLTKPVHPFNFLWALKCKLLIIRGVPFDFNIQQVVAEILQVVLDELKGISLATTSNLICNTQKITVSCNINNPISYFNNPTLLIL